MGFAPNSIADYADMNDVIISDNVPLRTDGYSRCNCCYAFQFQP